VFTRTIMTNASDPVYKLEWCCVKFRGQKCRGWFNVQDAMTWFVRHTMSELLWFDCLHNAGPGLGQAARYAPRSITECDGVISITTLPEITRVGKQHTHASVKTNMTQRRAAHADIQMTSAVQWRRSWRTKQDTRITMQQRNGEWKGKAKTTVRIRGRSCRSEFASRGKTAFVSCMP
jgi:hypothetical protein